MVFLENKMCSVLVLSIIYIYIYISPVLSRHLLFSYILSREGSPTLNWLVVMVASKHEQLWLYVSSILMSSFHWSPKSVLSMNALNACNLVVIKDAWLGAKIKFHFTLIEVV